MAGPRRNRSADVQVDDVPKKHRKVSDDDAADDAEDPAEEAEVAEEEEEEEEEDEDPIELLKACLLYTSPSPRDKRQSRMPSSA